MKSSSSSYITGLASLRASGLRPQYIDSSSTSSFLCSSSAMPPFLSRLRPPLPAVSGTWGTIVLACLLLPGPPPSHLIMPCHTFVDFHLCSQLCSTFSADDAGSKVMISSPRRMVDLWFVKGKSELLGLIMTRSRIVQKSLPCIRREGGGLLPSPHVLSFWGIFASTKGKPIRIDIEKNTHNTHTQKCTASGLSRPFSSCLIFVSSQRPQVVDAPQCV